MIGGFALGALRQGGGERPTLILVKRLHEVEAVGGGGLAGGGAVLCLEDILHVIGSDRTPTDIAERTGHVAPLMMQEGSGRDINPYLVTDAGNIEFVERLHR